MRLTDYQRESRDKARELGLFLRDWRRQGGKTTTVALSSLRTMAAVRGALVTFASASLLVGREITFREAALYQDLVKLYASQVAARHVIESVDTASGLQPERADDFAEAFASGRLETRLYHDRTTYSRTQVIAPNPATARGFSGFVEIDEIGWIKNFREVWDAMEPIFSRDPSFRCGLSTTPPADDAHYSHELMVPPVGMEFPESGANPAGHWYRSQAGILVHRVDVHDAAAAGVKLYDPETRKELTPAEHRAKAIDREAWDRNYALAMAKSGTAACSLLALHTAQRHPMSALCVAVDTDEEIPPGWEQTLTGGQVGIGIDLATTEGEASNPTSLAVVEKVPTANAFAVRLLARWKTADPNRSRAIYRVLLAAVSAKLGLRPRGLGIDATNERYFATDLQRELAGVVSVTLVISSENTVYKGVEMPRKEYLGNLVVNALDDAQLVLPAAEWVQRDFRLVKKKAGRFVTDVDSQGNHGDSFDAVKLAIDRLVSANVAGPIKAFARGKTRAGSARSREVAG